MNSIRRYIRKVEPYQTHGLVFDGLVLAFNAGLAGMLPVLGDDTPEFTAGALLLIAVAAQIAGAVFKQRDPGYQARTANGFSGFGRAIRLFMRLLLFFHFILFSVVFLFGLALLDIYRPGEPGLFGTDGYWVLLALAMGAVTTGVVRRAGGSNEREPVVDLGASWGEWTADGFLLISAALLTSIFWRGLVSTLSPVTGVGLTSTSLVLLLGISALFVFFYLPARYLFLIEDYHSPLTWVQVWLAALPLAWRVVFGGI